MFKLTVFFLNSEHEVVQSRIVSTRHEGLLSAKTLGLEDPINEKRATPQSNRDDCPFLKKMFCYYPKSIFGQGGITPDRDGIHFEFFQYYPLPADVTQYRVLEHLFCTRYCALYIFLSKQYQP
jgi:hypothetical protein